MYCINIVYLKLTNAYSYICVRWHQCYFYSLITSKFIGKQNVLCHDDTLEMSIKIALIVLNFCEIAIHDFSIKILNSSNPACDYYHV